jgi:hypothetical protein
LKWGNIQVDKLRRFCESTCWLLCNETYRERYLIQYHRLTACHYFSYCQEGQLLQKIS